MGQVTDKTKDAAVDVADYFCSKTQVAERLLDAPEKVVASLIRSLLAVADDRYGVDVGAVLASLADDNSGLQNHTQEVVGTVVVEIAGVEQEFGFLEELSTGNAFAVHASYLEQELPVYSPYGNGELTVVELSNPPRLAERAVEAKGDV